MIFLARIFVGLLCLVLVQPVVLANPFLQKVPVQPDQVSYPWQKPLLKGPTYSIRELAWKADLVLRVESGPLNTWKIREVAYGGPVTEVPPSPMPDTYPRGSREWIGFWRSTPGGYELLPTGIRAQNAEGQVWIPGQADAGFEYGQLMDDLKTDLKALIILKTDWMMKDRIVRNRKIWQWAKDRENQFGGGITNAGSMGWGSVEQDLLMEVMLGPDDVLAWEALNLYARTNSNEMPPLKEIFASTSRREMLLRKARMAALSGERVRALLVLGSPFTWQSGSTEGQWTTLNGILKTAVQNPSPELSKATLGAIKMLASFAQLEPDLLELAWKRYLEMAPGVDRAHWAGILARILGTEVWKQRTGNEAGLVVAFDKLVWSENQISWTLSRIEGKGGSQPVQLIREKLDEKGKVIETQTNPLVDKETKPWNQEKPLQGEWNATTWPTGLWRIQAVSKTTPEWKSEPRQLQVIKPLKLPGITPPGIGTIKVVIDPPNPKGR